MISDWATFQLPSENNQSHRFSMMKPWNTMPQQGGVSQTKVVYWLRHQRQRSLLENFPEASFAWSVSLNDASFLQFLYSRRNRLAWFTCLACHLCGCYEFVGCTRNSWFNNFLSVSVWFLWSFCKVPFWLPCSLLFFASLALPTYTPSMASITWTLV